MSGISFHQGVAVTGSTSSTSLSLTLPTSLQTGDAVFAFVSYRATLTAPSGWTFVASVNYNAGAVSQWTAIYRKNSVSSSDSGTTATFTQSSSTLLFGQTCAIRAPGGVISVLESATSSVDNSTTYQITPPTVTATRASEIFLSVIGDVLGPYAPYGYGLPSGTTIVASLSGNFYTYSVYQARTSGQSNSGTWTFSNETATTNNGLGVVVLRLAADLSPETVTETTGMSDSSTSTRLTYNVTSLGEAAFSEPTVALGKSYLDSLTDQLDMLFLLAQSRASTTTDGVRMAESVSRGRLDQKTASDVITSLDSTVRRVRALPVTVEDIAVELTQANQFLFRVGLLDFARLPWNLESASAQMFYKPVLTQPVSFDVANQKLLVARGALASDTVTASYSFSLSWAKNGLLRETVSALDISDMVWLYKPAVSEMVRVKDTLTFASLVALAETIGVASSFVVQRAIRVLEALRLSDVAAAPLIFGRTFAEQVRIASSLANFFGADVSEGLAIEDLLSRIARVKPTLSQGVGVQAVVARQMILRVVAPDTIDFDDATVLQMLFGPALADDVELAAAYVEPNGSITTWNINARTGAVTEYENYEFNSFANFGQMYLAADSQGLYELDGVNDEGSAIIARIRSGLAQLGGSRFTMLRDAYVGIRGNGKYVLRVLTGDGQTYDYSFDVFDSMATTRVQLGKGMRARYIAFELISTGSDFDLESVEFIPLTSTRRV